MTAAALDVYLCPKCKHRTRVPHIDAAHRPRSIPCRRHNCPGTAEFEREEGDA